MPTAVISNATRIWEINIYWSLYSQCGIWDPKGCGVEIWECIRAYPSSLNCSQSTTMLIRLLPQPPNGIFWRYIARR
ncbi:hypothetical protein SERLA73DRAFT_102057 [Serpula lacrymans var. lacrymans S7.3]|uniref:Uncharacterized protein n=1 Tax=Serpula lacrymans var. lacrymans (strain S7.3) TaxID=936435 RepID=F8PJV2_SERL3|nr:hypothetical protein SERLA73DRAFT_102057 [Serpula lacrymans var. lacrymans S7.3]